MNLTPIIKSKLANYKNQNCLEDLTEDELFERFVNQTILTKYNSSAFDYASELLDRICVGGPNDMGIDGIAIKINGNLIANDSDIYSEIERRNELDIEFIFLQSKYKRSFSFTEYVKFTTGIEKFLSNNPSTPYNEKIDYWIKLKNIIFSPDAMCGLAKMPTIKIYYVTIGKWCNDEHILSETKRFKGALEEMSYRDIEIDYIGDNELLTMCNNNANLFSITLDFVDMFALTDVNGVDNSTVILLNANELLKLLKTPENILRRNLFNDNVRDYQQETNINNEIRKTIESEPQNFVLLNNGITIVCERLISSNRKITIRNPQIVNGCQTCNEIFLADKRKYNLEKVAIIAKVISTTDAEITNKIVQGTNRQNIVYDEAFEVTREFHKKLEQFFIAMSSEQLNSDTQIYYERRAKQFYGHPQIKIYQKINFKILIQSYISIFQYKPEEGFKHESKLLQRFNNIIFNELHSLFPYFYAPSLSLRLESYFRQERDRLLKFRSYKNHILMLIPLIIHSGKRIPDVNNQKEVEKYCSPLLELIQDFSIFTKYTEQALDIFNKVQEEWISTKGETFKHGIKDSSEFTSFLLEYISGARNYHADEKRFSGIVTALALDRNSQIYGFISRKPHKIFFHQKDNPHIDCRILSNQKVYYEVALNKKTNQEKAINIELIPN